MGATNFTTYYNLSQFIGTDKPAWLQDYNGDMLKIDTGINGAKTAADAAALAASTAQGTADANTGSISTLNTTVATHTNQITTLSGAVNTINSLIGNGTPTTTDQTIIGAINEIHAELNYSTSETVCGKWIDGKTLYRKVIDCGIAPSAATNAATVYTFPSDVSFVRFVGGFCDGNGSSLPYLSSTDLIYTLLLNVAYDNNEWIIRCWSGSDRSSYGRMYAIVEYTK